MPRKTIVARVVLDQQAALVLERLADAEGRHRQRNMGMLLERIAALFEDDPDQLVTLGILSKVAGLSAVAR